MTTEATYSQQIHAAIVSTQEQEQMRLMALANTQGDKFAEYERGCVRDARTGRIIKSEHGLNNDLNNVSFSLEARLNKVETYKAARPVYTDMEFVTIISPGKEKEFTVHSPVEQFHIWAYPEEYKRFKSGQTAQISGMPLTLWPELLPSQIKELDYQGIKTVEQLASCPENIPLMNLHSLKAKAREFLERTKDIVAAAVVDDRLAQQQAAHKAELDAMNARLDQLVKLVAEKDRSTSNPQIEEPSQHLPACVQVLPSERGIADHKRVSPKSYHKKKKVEIEEANTDNE